MHGHRMIERLAVEPAHVALRIVEAHAPMDQEDLGEPDVDGAMRLPSARVSRGDLDKGPEEGPAPPDVSA
jgi:hypothetical protein